MILTIQSFYDSLKISPTLSGWASFLTVLFLIAVVSIIINYVLKHYIVAIVKGVINKTSSKFGQVLGRHKVFHRLSHIGPGLVIFFAVPLSIVPKLPETHEFSSIVQTLASVYIIIAFVMCINAFLNVVNDYYKTLPFSYKHPIRGYLQVAKIIVWGLTIISCVSIVLDKSPWAFLTGLGAVSAVLMLVFKDTILGFVSSIQVSAYDMVRVGDWIQIDKMGVNGDVIELNINTVKVKNFDNTMVTIPTYALINEGVINWRAMSESGGRRIKRAINVDMSTIHFVEGAELERFRKLHLLNEYIDERTQEISDFNASLNDDGKHIGNGRCLTNIGLFRAYIVRYLRHHPKIHQSMTLMVRQLDPTPTGLPIQLYTFTNDVKWVNYEDIQSDIFDHILAVMPLFGLEAYQSVSGKFVSAQ